MSPAPTVPSVCGAVTHQRLGSCYVDAILHPHGPVRPDRLVASHSLFLAAAVLALPGLLRLARSRGALSTAARRAAWVAAGASALWILEGIPHLLAPFDESAVLAGQPTPFLTGHLIGAVIVYPLVGFSIASLAVLSGRSLVHPIIGLVGAMGAAAFGLALDASTVPSGANRRSVPNGDSARLRGRDSAPNGGGSRKPSER